MNIEIKPCPFCGGKPVVYGNSKACCVVCRECNANIVCSCGRDMYPETKAKAIERWNSRATADIVNNGTMMITI